MAERRSRGGRGGRGGGGTSVGTISFDIVANKEQFDETLDAAGEKAVQTTQKIAQAANQANQAGNRAGQQQAAPAQTAQQQQRIREEQAQRTAQLATSIRRTDQGGFVIERGGLPTKISEQTVRALIQQAEEAGRAAGGAFARSFQLAEAGAARVEQQAPESASQRRRRTRAAAQEEASLAAPRPEGATGPTPTELRDLRRAEQQVAFARRRRAADEAAAAATPPPVPAAPPPIAAAQAEATARAREQQTRIAAEREAARFRLEQATAAAAEPAPPPEPVRRPRRTLPARPAPEPPPPTEAILEEARRAAEEVGITLEGGTIRVPEPASGGGGGRRRGRTAAAGGGGGGDGPPPGGGGGGRAGDSFSACCERMLAALNRINESIRALPRAPATAAGISAAAGAAAGGRAAATGGRAAGARPDPTIFSRAETRAQEAVQARDEVQRRLDAARAAAAPSGGRFFPGGAGAGGTAATARPDLTALEGQLRAANELVTARQRTLDILTARSTAEQQMSALAKQEAAAEDQARIIANRAKVEAEKSAAATKARAEARQKKVDAQAAITEQERQQAEAEQAAIRLREGGDEELGPGEAGLFSRIGTRTPIGKPSAALVRRFQGLAEGTVPIEELVQPARGFGVARGAREEAAALGEGRAASGRFQPNVSAQLLQPLREPPAPPRPPRAEPGLVARTLSAVGLGGEQGFLRLALNITGIGAGLNIAATLAQDLNRALVEGSANAEKMQQSIVDLHTAMGASAKGAQDFSTALSASSGFLTRDLLAANQFTLALQTQVGLADAQRQALEKSAATLAEIHGLDVSDVTKTLTQLVQQGGGAAPELQLNLSPEVLARRGQFIQNLPPGQRTERIQEIISADVAEQARRSREAFGRLGTELSEVTRESEQARQGLSDFIGQTLNAAVAAVARGSAFIGRGGRSPQQVREQGILQEERERGFQQRGIPSIGIPIVEALPHLGGLSREDVRSIEAAAVAATQLRIESSRAAEAQADALNAQGAASQASRTASEQAIARLERERAVRAQLLEEVQALSAEEQQTAAIRAAAQRPQEFTIPTDVERQRDAELAAQQAVEGQRRARRAQEEAQSRDVPGGAFGAQVIQQVATDTNALVAAQERLTTASAAETEELQKQVDLKQRKLAQSQDDLSLQIRATQTAAARSELEQTQFALAQLAGNIQAQRNQLDFAQRERELSVADGQAETRLRILAIQDQLAPLLLAQAEAQDRITLATRRNLDLETNLLQIRLRNLDTFNEQTDLQQEQERINADFVAAQARALTGEQALNPEEVAAQAARQRDIQLELAKKGPDIVRRRQEEENAQRPITREGIELDLVGKQAEKQQRAIDDQLRPLQAALRLEQARADQVTRALEEARLLEQPLRTQVDYAQLNYDRWKDAADQVQRNVDLMARGVTYVEALALGAASMASAQERAANASERDLAAKQEASRIATVQRPPTGVPQPPAVGTPQEIGPRRPAGRIGVGDQQELLPPRTTTNVDARINSGLGAGGLGPTRPPLPPPPPPPAPIESVTAALTEINRTLTAGNTQEEKAAIRQEAINAALSNLVPILQGSQQPRQLTGGEPPAAQAVSSVNELLTEIYRTLTVGNTQDEASAVRQEAIQTALSNLGQLLLNPPSQGTEAGAQAATEQAAQQERINQVGSVLQDLQRFAAGGAGVGADFRGPRPTGLNAGGADLTVPVTLNGVTINSQADIDQVANETGERVKQAVLDTLTSMFQNAEPNVSPRMSGTGVAP